VTEMIRITVDGNEVEVPKGQLLIQAAQDAGTYIPRFCWHPRMNPVGMCRMCLVEIETPRGPMMITACTNPVADGMVVDTQNDTVKKAQEGILEFLLANHPLDCPVCDKGGECPLQDQAMAYGPGESRFVEEKRHYEKPVPISDLVLLDRERCILCARCTRFSDEISGDPLIEFKDRGNATQVNTFPDLPFSSYFSGNTVQICPVGALTSSAYRFRARPWDLKIAESSSPHDSAQPRIAIHASQNEVLRFTGVDSEGVNHGWLSDKARFGFEYINSEERLTTPLVRSSDGTFRSVSWAEALDLVATRLDHVKQNDGDSAVAALGGARGTNEDAYALSKFMRVAVGSNSLDAQMDDGLDPSFLVGTRGRARISDLDSAKTILVWGPDLKEIHPTLYLRVRRAVQELGAKLVVCHPRRTGLDDRATYKFTYRPGQGSSELSSLKAGTGAHTDATTLLADGGVVALVGRSGYTEDPRLAEAVAAYVLSLPDSKVMPLAHRSNVYGAVDMGVSPNLLPGRATAGQFGDSWGELPVAPGRDCGQIIEAVNDGDVVALLLVGSDPVRDMPDGARAALALERCEFVVSFDQFMTDSSRLADVILPVDGFGEKDGTVTNVEGRVQKVNQIVPGAGQSRPDWSILDDLARRMGVDLGFHSAEGINKEIAAVAPAYAGVTWDRLEWDDREGVVVPDGEGHQPLQVEPSDVAGALAAGDLVLHSARTMYDDGVALRHSPSLAGLAPGGALHIHPDEVRRLGLTLGGQATVRTDHGSATLQVVPDTSLLLGVVYVPFNQPGVPSLGSSALVEVVPV